MQPSQRYVPPHPAPHQPCIQWRISKQEWFCRACNKTATEDHVICDAHNRKLEWYGTDTRRWGHDADFLPQPGHQMMGGGWQQPGQPMMGGGQHWPGNQGGGEQHPGNPMTGGLQQPPGNQPARQADVAPAISGQRLVHLIQCLQQLRGNIDEVIMALQANTQDAHAGVDPSGTTEPTALMLMAPRPLASDVTTQPPTGAAGDDALMSSPSHPVPASNGGCWQHQ